MIFFEGDLFEVLGAFLALGCIDFVELHTTKLPDVNDDVLFLSVYSCVYIHVRHHRYKCVHWSGVAYYFQNVSY